MIRKTPRALRSRLTAVRLAPAFCLTVLAAPVEAADPLRPDPATGLAIAERLCKTCHLVEGPGAVTVQAGVPSMRGIANLPGQSGARIRDTLIQPAHPMPDLRATMEEIAHLTAYLESLRTDKSKPPLIEIPAVPAKPKSPSPS